MEFTLDWLLLALSALISVAVYSYLYRENMAFRLAEHIIIGSFTGHGLVMAIKNINESAVARVSAGEIAQQSQRGPSFRGGSGNQYR